MLSLRAAGVRERLWLLVALLAIGGGALAVAAEEAKASHPYTCFVATPSCGMGNMAAGARACGGGTVKGMFMNNQSVARPKTIYLSFPCQGDVLNGQRWDTSVEQIFSRHTNTTYPTNYHANCWNRDAYTVTVNCGRMY